MSESFNRNVRLAGWALAIIACAALAGMLTHRGPSRGKVMALRLQDVRALLQVCLATNNLTNTAALLTAAAHRGVLLRSPIARDPSKPCYELVVPWRGDEERTNPQTILIRETNITDTNGVFVVMMDGSLSYANAAALRFSMTNQAQGAGRKW